MRSAEPIHCANGRFTPGSSVEVFSLVRPVIWGRTTMKKKLGLALALLLAIGSNGGTIAQTQTSEQKIWTLLDDSKAACVSLGEAEFRALGAGFDLPDGGRSVARLAEQAPGGSFDPRAYE